MDHRKAIAIASVGSLLAALWEKRHRIRMQALEAEKNKLLDNYQLLNHWLEMRNEGHSAAEYFENMGYRHIAIYGMAELANRLSEELLNSGIQIDYGIDKDVSCTIARIEEVYSLQDELPLTDVIVVTPYYAFESIYKNLKEKIDCPIISIEDVIWSI